MVQLFTLLISCLSFLLNKDPKPVFKPDSLVIDYDSIAYGSNGYRELFYTNTGDAPLILDVRSSCGCLVPYTPKNPTLPGERDKIGAQYDTKRVGRFRKTLTVITNEVDADPTITKMHIIQVVGYVKPALESPALPQK